jgi:inactive STAND
MLWIEFLQKIVNDEKCNFGRGAKERFPKIFGYEDSKKYDVEQFQLARNFYSAEFDQEQFGEYLREIYKAMEPLNPELLKGGRGRPKGPKTKAYRVHVWLRQLYEAEQGSLECPQQASAPMLTTEHALHEQLKKFNYFPQQGQFCDVVNQALCSAFLVRVDGAATQTWLVRRLAEEIPNFLSSKRVAINVMGRYPNADLFTELAQGILGTISRSEPEDIVGRVAELCRTKNITIALYGISGLEPEDWECLRDFWERLVKAVDQGKCTLLLTEDTDFSCSVVLPELHQLTAWETVPINLWNTWVDRDEVQELCRSCSRSVPDRPFRGTPPIKPGRALERICHEFDISEPVIRVMTDKIWNLAA